MATIAMIATTVGVLLSTGRRADALVIEGSFSGTITSALSTESVFGLNDTQMIGQSISGTFRYDTDSLPPLDSASTSVFGAWLSAYPSTPSISMTETVNGRTLSYGGHFYQ